MRHFQCGIDDPELRNNMVRKVCMTQRLMVDMPGIVLGSFKGLHDISQYVNNMLFTRYGSKDQNSKPCSVSAGQQPIVMPMTTL